jgi:SAM-dependent methyltransferase
MSEPMPETMTTELRDLILNALGAEYTSVSSVEGVETGNHYQSVALGDIRTSGFREDRATLLDMIDFERKTVLDLGSNLGEVSRAARARGAALVDGFEYDPYFIEVADLINVFTGATRVSFFERDISDDASFAQHYDVVLAFAVFGQGLNRSLPKVAEICDGILVLETHRLEGNFEYAYMEPISRYFPRHRVIGQTQWGSPFDERETRAVVVFAKEEGALGEALLDRGPVPVESEARRDVVRSETRRIDVARSNPHQVFYAHFDNKTGDELLRAIAEARDDGELAGLGPDLLHWVCYLRGYLQYRDSGEIGPGNAYYDHLVSEAEVDPAIDPGIAGQLRDRAGARNYVQRQFADLDRFRDRASDGDLADEIEPLRVLVGERGTPAELVVIETRGNPVFAKRFDGWHRLFAARLFGVPELRCEFVEDRSRLQIRGSVDFLGVEGGRLRIEGWCLDPDCPADRIELTAAGRRLAGVQLAPRPDIAAAFSHVPHAMDSGFTIECDYPGGGETVARFDVTAFKEFLPLGHMSAYWAPWLSEKRPWPPKRLGKRLMNAVAPSKLAVEGLGAASEMLDPVGRCRDLDSFRTVLDFGCRFGQLETYLAHLLPEASLSAVDSDPDAVRWCRKNRLPGEFETIPEDPPTSLPEGSFDLVLGYSTLPRLDRDAQARWLDELARVTKRGSYVALSLYGELARRFLADAATKDRLDAEGIITLGQEAKVTYQRKAHTVRECERRFDVIAYREGVIDNHQDLIVLRKA